MENLIEHEGKKYRVMKDKTNLCEECDFLYNLKMCYGHIEVGFPDCVNDEVHFELVEETNLKE